jgi:hypothetical protein
MDPDFHRRIGSNAVERAMLVSASFEMWRRKHCRAPFYVPPAARNVIPKPFTQCAHDFCSLEHCKRKEYVRDSVYRQLDSDHPERGLFLDGSATRTKSRAAKGTKSLAPTASPELDNPLRSNVGIKFENEISTVTVSAVFENVSAQDADCILENAKPKRWRRAAPHFFKDISWGEFKNGTLVECAESLESHRKSAGGTAKALDEDHYQIEEFVEWYWKPEMTGGAITILDIKMDIEAGLQERFEADSWREEFIDTIVGRVVAENQADPNVTSKHFRPAKLPSGVATTAYSYELLRCEQTKLLSSWEVGGLDVDDGTYIGLWVPTSKDTGNLFVEATKAIRYSLQADVFAGFSQILNMLTPTVESTIMNQLAYEGTIRFLKKSSEMNGKGDCQAILDAVNEELHKELA